MRSVSSKISRGFSRYEKEVSASMKEEDITDQRSEDLPEDVRRSLDGIIDQDEEVKIAISSDLTYDGRYGTTWMIVTSKRIIGLEQGHGDGILQIPISSAREVKLKQFVGNGVLEVHTEERAYQVLRFTRSTAQKVGRVVGELEAMVKGEKKEDLPSHHPQGLPMKVKCPKCGAAIPRWLDVCPRCLRKTHLLKRLLAYIKPYWHIATLSLALTIALTVMNLAPPYLMKILTDSVLAPKTVMAISDRVRILIMVIISLLGIQIATGIVSGARGYIMEWLGQKIIYTLRTQVFEKIQHLTLSFFDMRQTGQIMARITYDTGNLQDFIVEGVQDLIINILTLIGITFMLFYMNWQLALLTMAPIPLLIVGTMFFGRKLHKIFHRVWRRWAVLSAILADTIPGIRVVKAFAQERREIARFRDKTEEVVNAHLTAAKIWTVYFPTMGFLTSLGSIIIWGVGGVKVINGELSLGVLMAFTGYMWQFYGPVRVLCNLNNRLQRAATAAERVFEVLDAEPEAYNDPDAITLPEIKGDIVFENVTFSYDGIKPALQNINLHIKPGEMIGLVGPSGAGKSTLIKLICRFYEPQEGNIYVDGYSIKDVSLKSLRSQIGIVPQDPYLFHGSVLENIAYAKPDARFEDVVRAAKAANAHNFIMNFPEAYDTQVGERGVMLSGGEMQRVSIARAILANPRILILDEATSSVDTETEMQIQQAIERLVEGRTTIAIAHRLSTLRKANKLVVLDQGRLVDIGTHEELISREGLYKRLCELQSELSKIRAW